MSLLERLQSLDAYSKLPSDMRVKTLSGAAISLTTLLLISLLVVSEYGRFVAVRQVDHLYVDPSDDQDAKLKINFDVTFPHIPCKLLSLDAMDVSGTHLLDVRHNILKQPLDANGDPIGLELKHDLGGSLKPSDLKNTTKGAVTDIEDPRHPQYCGSCYGAEQREGQCCNTCDDVREAYRVKQWGLDELTKIKQCVREGHTNEQFLIELNRGDGCRMRGYLKVAKVDGNFHFAPGKSFQNAHVHVHDMAAIDAGKFNVSHTINSISFGDSFPGAVNPLDGRTRIATEGGTMLMYYTKVVPTSYKKLNGETIDTNQFSVTEHTRLMAAPVHAHGGGHAHGSHAGLPGVFVLYELSPIFVQVQETRGSFSHFITQVVAILGGIFTLAGVVDKFVYKGIRTIEKKMDVGKLS